MLRLFPYLLLAGAAAYASQPAGSIVLPAGTELNVRINRPLDTNHDPAGTQFTATISAPVMHKGEIVVPQGALCRGHLVESKNSGRLKGRAVMSLALDSVEFQGRTYPIAAFGPGLATSNHKKRNLKWIGGGSAGGTVLGALVGGGTGAAVGLGLGAVAGTAGAAATGEKQVYVAAETPMTFKLQKPAAFPVAVRARR